MPSVVCMRRRVLGARNVDCAAWGRRVQALLRAEDLVHVSVVPAVRVHDHVVCGPGSLQTRDVLADVLLTLAPHVDRFLLHVLVEVARAHSTRLHVDQPRTRRSLLELIVELLILILPLQVPHVVVILVVPKASRIRVRRPARVVVELGLLLGLRYHSTGQSRLRLCAFMANHLVLFLEEFPSFIYLFVRSFDASGDLQRLRTGSFLDFLLFLVLQVGFNLSLVDCLALGFLGVQVGLLQEVVH